jgi:glutathione S-transferase
LVRVLFERFDELAAPYYALRRDPSSRSARGALDEALDNLDGLLEQQPYLSGAEYGLADAGYVPWLFRAEAALGVDVRTRSALGAWLHRLEKRPAVAAELAVVVGR